MLVGGLLSVIGCLGVLVLGFIGLVWFATAVNQSGAVPAYSTAVSGASATATPAPAPLRLVSARDYQEGQFVYIVGEVSNDGDRLYRSVRVTATYYDAAGAMVGTDFAYVDPPDMPPGETRPFRIAVSPGVPDFARYNLRVAAGG